MARWRDSAWKRFGCCMECAGTISEVAQLGGRSRDSCGSTNWTRTSGLWAQARAGGRAGAWHCGPAALREVGGRLCAAGGRCRALSLSCVWCVEQEAARAMSSTAVVPSAAGPGPGPSGGPGGGTEVIQVTNVSPSASSEQMRTLFGFLGKIDELRLFPPEWVPGRWGPAAGPSGEAKQARPGQARPGARSSGALRGRSAGPPGRSGVSGMFFPLTCRHHLLLWTLDLLVKSPFRKKTNAVLC